MNSSKKVGNYGENLAEFFLKKKSVEILKRNFYTKFGEIDIIAQTQEYLLFIEVKTTREDSYVLGRERVDLKKQRKIIITSQIFLSQNVICEKQPRFDVIEIVFNKSLKEFKINHIENAFNIL